MSVLFECRKNTVQLIKAQPMLDNHVSLVGSWTVDVGDQDQALHLWQYSRGFAIIDEASEILNKDQVRATIDRWLFGMTLGYNAMKFCVV